MKEVRAPVLLTEGRSMPTMNRPMMGPVITPVISVPTSSMPGKYLKRHIYGLLVQKVFKETNQTTIPDDKSSTVAENAEEYGEDLGEKSLLVLAKVLPHPRADKVLQGNSCQGVQSAAYRAKDCLVQRKTHFVFGIPDT